MKFVFWTMLFTGMAFMGIPSANAIIALEYDLGLLCGPPNPPPMTIHVGSSHRTITASATTTVLNQGTEDRKQLRQFVVLKSLMPDGSVDWTRSLQVQSLAIAEVDLDDTPPSYSLPDAVDLDDRPVAPALFLSSECLSVSLASSGSNNYLTVALGTTSSTGGPVAAVAADQSMNHKLMASGNKTLAPIKGVDKTVINVLTLNINNGKVVRTHKVRARPNHFFQLATSGIYDVDNDFNDELVLSFVRFIGEYRYDFIFEHYNIATGALERTTTSTQFDQRKFLGFP